MLNTLYDKKNLDKKRKDLDRNMHFEESSSNTRSGKINFRLNIFC